ncbi:uncharacterized protein UHO2_03171 [Ustilago hordei]|uniref:uncharacterized protein n=1 Tax=Ustilago hordei TaxID=120017 RepID=UPI001A54B5F8|nr:uncharacterized protein UHO2_06894 [Ustilago hordei]XP_041414020.1 uncharacterized protein UHO2_03171 [Ustilago hordei]SYW83698.1 uncharacterized protein UHO2_06894 [Ustilago hordei]SYW83955.1 uncharacterized protein UHO2_03171 [Ustilago hordei]
MVKVSNNDPAPQSLTSSIQTPLLPSPTSSIQTPLLPTSSLPDDLAFPSPAASLLSLCSSLGHMYRPNPSFLDLERPTTSSSDHRDAVEVDLACTPAPPSLDHHVPTNGEIAGWSEGLVVSRLVVKIATGDYPPEWEVGRGSSTEQQLHCLAMLRMTEGCMPWPSWQCARCASLSLPCFPSAFVNPFIPYSCVPRTCTHCHLGNLLHCKQTIPVSPDMEYLGDGPPNRQPQGTYLAEHVHLTVTNGYGLGFVCANDQVTDPDTSDEWIFAIGVLWHSPN